MRPHKIMHIAIGKSMAYRPKPTETSLAMNVMLEVRVCACGCLREFKCLATSNARYAHKVDETTVL